MGCSDRLGTSARSSSLSAALSLACACRTQSALCGSVVFATLLDARRLYIRVLRRGFREIRAHDARPSLSRLALKSDLCRDGRCLRGDRRQAIYCLGEAATLISFSIMLADFWSGRRASALAIHVPMITPLDHQSLKLALPVCATRPHHGSRRWSPER